MEIDIPKIWQYLGELVSPMVQDGSVPLSFLGQACEPLIRGNKAGILVAEVLKDASHRLGHGTVSDQWKQSGLKWSDFLPQSENIPEFIAKHVSVYNIQIYRKNSVKLKIQICERQILIFPHMIKSDCFTPRN